MQTAVLGRMLAAMEIFSGEPVYLRPLDQKHMQRSLAWFQDDATALLTLNWHLPLNTVESQQRWLANMQQSDADYVFAIHETATGEHAGNIGIHGLDPKDRSAELGIFLMDGYQGRGLGTWAMRKMLLWSFAVRNAHRISLKVWAFNERAKAAYRRVGFVCEGTMREALWLDDRFWDVELWSVLRPEWEQRYPEDRLRAP